MDTPGCNCCWYFCSIESTRKVMWGWWNIDLSMIHFPAFQRTSLNHTTLHSPSLNLASLCFIFLYRFIALHSSSVNFTEFHWTQLTFTPLHFVRCPKLAYINLSKLEFVLNRSSAATKTEDYKSGGGSVIRRATLSSFVR